MTIQRDLAEIGARRRHMGRRIASKSPTLGSVIGESGNTYTVRLTPSRRIIVVAGAGCEWRFTHKDILDSCESLLFRRVATLLESKGITS